MTNANSIRRGRQIPNKFKTPLPPLVSKGGRRTCPAMAGAGGFKIPDNYSVRKVTLGNDNENDEVNFRDRDDKPFVMFCNGIRDLDDDLRKIKKCDVEEVVYKGMGICEVYEE